MRIGSLFSGYGGLDMAVEAVTGATTAWVSDIDPGACTLLAHRYPDVPNLGDISAIDWSAVEPVDVLTGGSPCQDLSHAGKRSGMTDGTRSNLWVAMREAIAQLRPGLVVWENVRGAYSAEADSALESCPRCVGDPRDRGPVLRALGRVLGDLSSLGYVGGWHGLRAADVGAPHGRFRVFVAAFPNGGQRRFGAGSRVAISSDGRTGSAHGNSDALLPTPRTSDTNGAGAHGEGGVDLRTAVSLLPTPRAGDGEKGGPNQRGSSGDLMLPSKAASLLPTPMVGSTSKASHGQISGDYRAAMAEALQNWGDYAEAIARWERLTRPAPPPTQPSKKGTPQLSPAFSEWMMGLPAGWVTDVPGLSRNQMLKLLGNGVVPAQAVAALTHLLTVEAAA